MKTAIFLATLLTFPAAPASADQKSLSALVAASVADAITTEQALARAPGAYEANRILGGSSVQRNLTKAAMTGGLVWGLARIGSAHPKLATILGWTAAGSLTAIAAHNAQIARTR